MKLEPICFDIPFEVWYRFEDGLDRDNVNIPLSKVPVEDLDYLLTVFRAVVFKQAGKKDPKSTSLRQEKNPYEYKGEDAKVYVGTSSPRVTFEPSFPKAQFNPTPQCTCGVCPECADIQRARDTMYNSFPSPNRERGI